MAHVFVAYSSLYHMSNLQKKLLILQVECHIQDVVLSILWVNGFNRKGQRCQLHTIYGLLKYPVNT